MKSLRRARSSSLSLRRSSHLNPAILGATICFFLLWIGLAFGFFTSVHQVAKTKVETTTSSFRQIPPHSAQESLHTDMNRGIVLCLHDKIVELGYSLILELRCLGNFDRIEVAHCGADEITQEKKDLLRKDRLVTLIDVCAESPEMVQSYRNYWIKPLAIIASSFDQVMLVDADAIFLQNPASLWDTEGYQRTGTLFFRDRLMAGRKFLGKQVNLNGRPVHYIEKIILQFDIQPFLKYKGIVGPRRQFYGPSKHIVESFAWTGRSGHYQESSVVLFDKVKQERAAKILEYIAKEMRHEYPGFAWGDKEAYFLACELAQSEYFMSPWAGSVINGNRDLQDHPDTLCGSLAHYFPDKNATDVELLHINGKSLLQYDMPTKTTANRKIYNQFNSRPSHVSPRLLPRNYSPHKAGGHCLNHLGAKHLSQHTLDSIARRRMHYNALLIGSTFGLHLCNK